ncbi:hypothetical protein pqer_cds_877 [Pandoravirus quercus]|uniref:Uncharacterized protein n=1 Tax=Pandoravirus quercus TaxID=2107709 RepID=A0A2U7UA40_9VIRU|nr:hypothetical protein pqer_cds_877 [Pandoravirus quercus]AVK75299.1 hypothetical protein pqer_cds_877 [Pandoravirus quercus]
MATADDDKRATRQMKAPNSRAEPKERFRRRALHQCQAHFERAFPKSPTVLKSNGLPFQDPNNDEAKEDWDKFLLFCGE